MVIIEIINGPLTPFSSNNHQNRNGAELTFNGRVRDTEHGKAIDALEYEQYEGMAEAELTELANEICQKFPIKDLFCKHRMGWVGIGETSLHVSIWSKHRKEAYAANEYIIDWLKINAPFWKKEIFENQSKWVEQTL